MVDALVILFLFERDISLLFLPWLKWGVVWAVSMSIATVSDMLQMTDVIVAATWHQLFLLGLTPMMLPSRLVSDRVLE